MTKTLQAAAASAVLVLAALASSQAFAQAPANLRTLSDGEMDRIAAGAAAAHADGLGEAHGEAAVQSSSTLATYVQSDQSIGASAGTAAGVVTASASSNAGAVASASSTLSLSVLLP